MVSQLLPAHGRCHAERDVQTPYPTHSRLSIVMVLQTDLVKVCHCELLPFHWVLPPTHSHSQAQHDAQKPCPTHLMVTTSALVFMLLQADLVIHCELLPLHWHTQAESHVQKSCHTHSMVTTATTALPFMLLHAELVEVSHFELLPFH